MAKRRTKDARKPLRISLGFALVFFLGFACSLAINAISAKADLMFDDTRISRIASLMEVLQTIGIGHFRKCESKVNRLHEILALSSVDDATEAGMLIASILIDGKNCNKYLVGNIDSRASLITIPFIGFFKGKNVPDQEISPALEDEQGLMLWMLHRINHEQLLFSPNSIALSRDLDEDDARQSLVEHWKYCCG